MLRASVWACLCLCLAACSVGAMQYNGSPTNFVAPATAPASDVAQAQAASYAPCGKPLCPVVKYDEKPPAAYTCDCSKMEEHPDCGCGLQDQIEQEEKRAQAYEAQKEAQGYKRVLSLERPDEQVRAFKENAGAQPPLEAIKETQCRPNVAGVSPGTCGQSVEVRAHCGQGSGCQRASSKCERPSCEHKARVAPCKCKEPAPAPCGCSGGSNSTASSNSSSSASSSVDEDALDKLQEKQAEEEERAAIKEEEAEAAEKKRQEKEKEEEKKAEAEEKKKETALKKKEKKLEEEIKKDEAREKKIEKEQQDEDDDTTESEMSKGDDDADGDTLDSTSQSS